jgi:hypothetical protein
MAHQEQMNYCTKISLEHKEHFVGKKVLDVGSLDINGNNRGYFVDCEYTGIDVGMGANVDVVSKGHEFFSEEKFDTIISTECFEHDMYYDLTIKNIVNNLLKSKGLFMFTCATTGRAEHGTRRTDFASAPLLGNYDDWADYYKNLTEEDIREVIDLDAVFSEYKFEVNTYSCDLYFYGIKK